ncbi:MAG: hypothetical protein JRF63_12455 [Deltaproteobacteria bacterium]|nr:hypothetical protein [Deltaproteobacteria bacterium]
MDIEFHYWITAIVANRAGFDADQTRIIAYSSQFVDDNDIRLSVVDRSTKEAVHNYISQTMDITKPVQELMRIYPLFHFVPGEPDAESARRRDGKMHILTTTPDSENANHLLDEALKSAPDCRHYRIGIASHAYVDSWAHQNFVGWFDDFNGMGKVLPNIGHADAAHNPDRVGHRWDDDRLINVVINNNHRFWAAAEKLFCKYCDYLEAAGHYTDTARPEWSALEQDLVAMMQPVSSRGSEKRQDKRLKAYGKALSWLKDYDELDWLDEAIETEVKGLRDNKVGVLAKFTLFCDEYFWREDVERDKTDWYRFQQAVRDHQAVGMAKIAPIYDQMNIDLWRV